MTPKPADLPLRYQTPDAWAHVALQDPLALLNDHAYLERKAAGNALELLNRWPEPNPPEYWVEKMTAIARDEVEHLATVTRLLARRGGQLERHHRNPYANDLRRLVRSGTGPLELMDRLMVSALIEARSCERFEVLSRCSDDAELVRLYSELWASENGHYRIFIDLARKVIDDDAAVEARWNTILDAEAELIQNQPPGPRMHAGVAG